MQQRDNKLKISLSNNRQREGRPRYPELHEDTNEPMGTDSNHDSYSPRPRSQRVNYGNENDGMLQAPMPLSIRPGTPFANLAIFRKQKTMQSSQTFQQNKKNVGLKFAKNTFRASSAKVQMQGVWQQPKPTEADDNRPSCSYHNNNKGNPCQYKNVYQKGVKSQSVAINSTEVIVIDSDDSDTEDSKGNLHDNEENNPCYDVKSPAAKTESEKSFENGEESEKSFENGEESEKLSENEEESDNSEKNEQSEHSRRHAESDNSLKGEESVHSFEDAAESDNSLKGEESVHSFEDAAESGNSAESDNSEEGNAGSENWSEESNNSSKDIYQPQCKRAKTVAEGTSSGQIIKRVTTRKTVVVEESYELYDRKQMLNFKDSKEKRQLACSKKMLGCRKSYKTLTATVEELAEYESKFGKSIKRRSESSDDD
ncbi:hypothetical protein ILUMI_27283 [Ignelater luminosus]|uniref:Uncharacterized protein n=1 Tax=Ignelater luminosus TaxID=2038154 RepID=A0A8K0FX00_IGNLU|nr:hypothetical protein ILUMI_27283 [Ignelater luminosus]